MDSVVLVALVVVVAAVLGARWETNPDSLRIITPDVLKSGRVGQHYFQELAASGGKPPYHWSVVGAPGLPTGTGLTVTNSGLITGFPQSEGEYSFRLSLSDARSKKRELDFRMKVDLRASTTSSAPSQ